MNLTEIIQSAQGGQAIDNLSRQFGLSPDQTQAAINALLPSLSAGLQNSVQNAGSLSAILGHLLNGQHQAAYQDPAAAQSDATAAAGNDVLGHLFGNNDAAAEIAGRASEITGIRPDVLQEMLPVLASIVMGGLLSAMHNGGHGGFLSNLGQLAGQAGGVGGFLGQALNQSAQQPGGGVLGTLLGNIFAGRQGQAATGSPAAGGIDPALIQAGMTALTNMFSHNR